MAFSAATRHLLRRQFCSSVATSSAETPSGIPQSTFNTVRQLARKRDAATIKSMLSPLLSTSSPPSETALASIVYLYSFSGMLKEAIDAFSSHPSPSTAALNSLLAPLNRDRILSRQIPSLFTSLPASKSVVPDRNTYGILIKSLCLSGGGGAEKALPVVKQMEEKNIPVNEVVYTTLIDSFYIENKPERAEQLWNEMCAKGIVPDVALYNVRAMYKAKNGWPKDVLELISAMEAANLKPDIVTYSSLILAYCANERFDEAMEVFKGLETKGCVPNYVTYNKFMNVLCKKGKFDDALYVFEDGLKRRTIPDLGAVKVLVKGLITIEKKEAAKRVVTRLRHKFPHMFNKGWKQLEEIVGLTEEEESQSDEGMDFEKQSKCA